MEKQPFNIGLKETREVVSDVREYYGVNFDGWSMPHLMMRLNAVMDYYGYRVVDQLRNRLIRNFTQGRGYFEEFLDLLLVRSTELFRDPSFWRVMSEQVLPMLGRESENGGVRCVVCNNDSGEELFSLLIVLEELGMLDKSHITVCYASEPRRERIERGELQEQQDEVESANYVRYHPTGTLDKWVEQRKDGRFLARELLTRVEYQRETCEPQLLDYEGVFDLALCRNQFLYYGVRSVEKQLAGLHRALRAGGILAVGVCERLDNVRISGKFTTVNGEERIYKRSGV